MIKLGQVSRETRGPDLNPIFYEDIVTCALGGPNYRPGSKCAF